MLKLDNETVRPIHGPNRLICSGAALALLAVDTNLARFLGNATLGLS